MKKRKGRRDEEEDQDEGSIQLLLELSGQWWSMNGGPKRNEQQIERR